MLLSKGIRTIGTLKTLILLVAVAFSGALAHGQQDPFALANEDPFGETSEVPFLDPFGPAPNDGEPGNVEDPFLSPARIPRATPTATPAPTPLPRVRVPRFRVTSPGSREEIRGIYVSALGPGIQDTGRVNQLTRDITAARFNRAYVEVRIPGGVAYPSQVEPTLGFLTRAFPNPVQLMKDNLDGEARIIAVVDLLGAHDAASGSRPSGDSPVNRYPGYVNRSLDGRTIAHDNLIYLDPGNPEVRRYLAGIVFEIARTIEPDGFLFRTAHYPGREWGYSDAAVDAFREAVGGEGPPSPDDPVWSSWRRAQVTNLLRDVRDAIELVSPGVPIGVQVHGAISPPSSWEDWTHGGDYSGRMMDWLRWSRDGLVEEVYLQYHFRNNPQDDSLRRWVDFLNSNVGAAQPVISLSGQRNTAQGLRNMASQTRAFGVGTVIHRYGAPARDYSSGFYASVPNVIFRSAFGNPLARRPILGEMEIRDFSPMVNPPPAAEQDEPSAPLPFAGRGEERDDLSGLRFETPTPVPTPARVRGERPERILRVVTLANGTRIEAIVVEVTEDSITLQTPDGVPVTLPRRTVREVDPPI